MNSITKNPPLGGFFLLKGFFIIGKTISIVLDHLSFIVRILFKQNKYGQ